MCLILFNMFGTVCCMCMYNRINNARQTVAVILTYSETGNQVYFSLFLSISTFMKR